MQLQVQLHKIKINMDAHNKVLICSLCDDRVLYHFGADHMQRYHPGVNRFDPHNTNRVIDISTEFTQSPNFLEKSLSKNSSSSSLESDNEREDLQTISKITTNDETNDEKSTNEKPSLTSNTSNRGNLSRGSDKKNYNSRQSSYKNRKKQHRQKHKSR
jgi:hypothetical protein